MNSRRFLLLLILALLSGGTQSSFAEADKDSAVKEAMRQKLVYSQEVMAGITLADYERIAKNAKKLVELSNKTNWYSRQVPEYELFLNEFRRNAQDLVSAGEQKNVDAATLAYVQMTFSCVSCHKFLRMSSGIGTTLDFRPNPYAAAKRPTPGI